MSSAFEGLPKTPNLKLNKPGYDNVADIEALNENADILDEEINTLKTNLKNKGSATEPVYFDSNGVPQKTKNFNDYLPLSGGKMTDTVIGRSVNDSLLTLIGGTNGDNGATLMLYGKDNSSGRFLIRATNGTNKLDLVGTADGGLTWANKNIVRSVDGVNADTAGNVDTGVRSIAKGGTGANNASQACANLGIGATIIASSLNTFKSYVKFSNGVIIQFGVFDMQSNQVDVELPISFPNGMYYIMLTDENWNAPDFGDSRFSIVRYTGNPGSGSNKNNFRVVCKESSIGSVQFLAIGY